jgi:hypothetical protein
VGAEAQAVAYPGRRDTVKSCGYVGDLVESLFFMREHAAPAVTYNFSYAPPPTIEQVCDALSRSGGCRGRSAPSRCR